MSNGLYGAGFVTVITESFATAFPSAPGIVVAKSVESTSVVDPVVTVGE